MQILKSEIFKEYQEVVFGFSTRKAAGRKPPFFFNLSLSVGDDKKNVEENRKLLYHFLGIDPANVAYQKQVHSDGIRLVDNGGFAGESDALITDKKNIGLAVSSADCTAVFIYDKKNKLIAAVHSGWRGTEKKILKKTINKIIENFNSSPDDLIAYIGPSICPEHSEVGEEVAQLFDKKYSVKNNGSFFLDVQKVNYDILLEAGVKKNNIEVSDLCTYEETDLLHSYRRDRIKSGRSLGIICMKE